MGKQTRLSVKEIEQNCTNCTGSEVSPAIGAPCEAGSVGNHKCIRGQRRLSLRWACRRPFLAAAPQLFVKQRTEPEGSRGAFGNRLTSWTRGPNETWSNPTPLQTLQNLFKIWLDSLLCKHVSPQTGKNVHSEVVSLLFHQAWLALIGVGGRLQRFGAQSKRTVREVSVSVPPTVIIPCKRRASAAIKLCDVKPDLSV